MNTWRRCVDTWRTFSLRPSIVAYRYGASNASFFAFSAAFSSFVRSFFACQIREVLAHEDGLSLLKGALVVVVVVVVIGAVAAVACCIAAMWSAIAVKSHFSKCLIALPASLAFGHKRTHTRSTGGRQSMALGTDA